MTWVEASGGLGSNLNAPAKRKKLADNALEGALRLARSRYGKCSVLCIRAITSTIGPVRTPSEEVTVRQLDPLLFRTLVAKDGRDA